MVNRNQLVCGFDDVSGYHVMYNLIWNIVRERETKKEGQRKQRKWEEKTTKNE